MTYWVPDYSVFIFAFHSHGASSMYLSSSTSSIIVLNILSLTIAACFSGSAQKPSHSTRGLTPNNIAVEAQIVWHLYQHLRMRHYSNQSSRVFGGTSIALGVGFIISTILLVTSHILKLNFVANIGKAIGYDGRLTTGCPSGYLYIGIYGGICYENNYDYWQNVMSRLDIALETLFQLMLIMGDSLLVRVDLRFS
jgi:hypothetical protein